MQIAMYSGMKWCREVEVDRVHLYNVFGNPLSLAFKKIIITMKTDGIPNNVVIMILKNALIYVKS